MGIRNFNVLLNSKIVRGLRVDKTASMSTTDSYVCYGLFVDTIAFVYPQLTVAIQRDGLPLTDDVYAKIANDIAARICYILGTATQFEHCFLAFDYKAPDYKRYTQTMRRNRPGTVYVPYNIRRHAFENVCGAVKRVCNDLKVTYTDSNEFTFGEGEQIALWAANRWIDKEDTENLTSRKAFVCGNDWDIILGTLISNYRRPGCLEFLKIPSANTSRANITYVMWQETDPAFVLSGILTSFVTGSDYFPGVVSGTIIQFKDMYSRLCASSVYADMSTVFCQLVKPLDDTGENDIVCRRALRRVIHHTLSCLAGSEYLIVNQNLSQSLTTMSTEECFQYDEAMMFALRILWTILYYVNAVYDASDRQFRDYDHVFSQTFSVRSEVSCLNGTLAFQSNRTTQTRLLTALLANVLYERGDQLLDDIIEKIFMPLGATLKFDDAFFTVRKVSDCVAIVDAHHTNEPAVYSISHLITDITTLIDAGWRFAVLPSTTPTVVSWDTRVNEYKTKVRMTVTDENPTLPDTVGIYVVLSSREDNVLEDDPRFKFSIDGASVILDDPHSFFEARAALLIESYHADADNILPTLLLPKSHNDKRYDDSIAANYRSIHVVILRPFRLFGITSGVFIEKNEISNCIL